MSLIKRVILHFFPELEKLSKIANAIETINIDRDGSMLIRTKRHCIVDVAGHHLLNAEGFSILQSTASFTNPAKEDRVQLCGIPTVIAYHIEQSGSSVIKRRIALEQEQLLKLKEKEKIKT